MEARPRLLDQVRQKLRTLHYSYRTEQQYVHWIRRLILFHDRRHPSTLGATEVEAYLTHLAVDRKVSASTQNQALAAILFLYKYVLESELPWLDRIVRAKRSQYLPVVLSPAEVASILERMEGQYRLIANLLYGSGLRITEALRLRVKDVNFAYRQVIVRDPPSRARLRHPHRAGTRRPPRREDHADLHARHAPRRQCRAESAGPVASLCVASYTRRHTWRPTSQSIRLCSTGPCASAVSAPRRRP